MSTFSDINICSGAALLVGADSFASFDEVGNPVASLCGNLYPALKEGILSGYPWRFQLERTILTRLSEAPSNQWTYQYLLPANRLGSDVRSVYQSSEVSATPFKNYSIEKNRLFTDAPEIHVSYVFETDESTWPPYFVLLMRYAMATEIAFAVAEDVGLQNNLNVKTYGVPSDNGLGGYMGQARSRNAQESPARVIADNTLIAARFGGLG